MDFQSATPPPPPDELNGRRWEVGIDFGGSNSTITCSMQTDSVRTEKAGLSPGEITEIKGYKIKTATSSRCIQNCDVPTVLRYENGGNTILWGYEVQERMKRVPIHDKEEGWTIWLFKAGFYDGNNPEEQEERRKVEDQLTSLPFSKSVDDLAVDYFTKLFEHTETAMEIMAYRKSCDTIHLNVTIPAMWGIKARHRIIKSIEKAGQMSGFKFSKNVYLCSEPEAATAYFFTRKMFLSWKASIINLLVVVCRS
jgi:hypothetical protein